MVFDSKTALVTGAAKRIGAAIAYALARKGANVVLHCRNSLDEAHKLAGVLRSSYGVKAWVESVDFAVPNAGKELFERTLNATGGKLDFIVNSASAYSASSLDSLTDEDLATMMRIHVEAPLELIRGISSLNDSPKSVVNILDARIGSFDSTHAAYMLSKQSLANLTRDLALELAPRVRVNAVAPGAVLEEDGAPRESLLRLAAFNPMGQVGNPDDLAEAVLFLLGADFITGQTLFYDGGYNLRSRRI